MLDAKVSLLIVDNDPSTRYSLCQIFRWMGHSVRAAEDGFYALEELRAETPDILLSDLNLPRMEGFQFLSVVRRRFPTVYVIAMSGGRQPEGAPRKVAADSFYDKASGVVALLQAVNDGIASDRVSVWASRKATPVWVSQQVTSEDLHPGQRDESDPADGSQVIIGCPECLRAFPQGLEASGSAQETTCVHCHAPINFAVVEPRASVIQWPAHPQ